MEKIADNFDGDQVIIYFKCESEKMMINCEGDALELPLAASAKLLRVLSLHEKDLRNVD